MVIVTLVCAAGALASNAPKTLQDFGIGDLRGGSSLYAGLILDSAGNAYGAAESGGIYNAGVVYELSPTASGPWTETVLYNFKGGANQDGANPHATLAWDSAGNLYGTTVSGGLENSSCRTGCGTVYKLTPSAGGWQETVLYRFTGGADGSVPYAGVTIDSAGNLYGAAVGGGASVGVVYELSPGDSGYMQTVIHTFEDTDGSAPFATPLLGPDGKLYGTTETGGSRNAGVVYALSPQSGGAWNFRVLHNFQSGSDGAEPLSGVILGPKGTLVGTTTIGGTANCGTAYTLAPNASDPKAPWTETIMHTFLGVEQQDGENPNLLLLSPKGILYGTSTGGGVDNPGTIFQIVHSAAGWQETVLYSFTAGNDGAYPSSGLAMDAAGNLYGTTLWGGPSGDTTGGVAFEFTP
jgi:uncharacterized repeat protein (TIGR03803 family)